MGFGHGRFRFYTPRARFHFIPALLLSTCLAARSAPPSCRRGEKPDAAARAIDFERDFATIIRTRIGLLDRLKKNAYAPHVRTLKWEICLGRHCPRPLLRPSTLRALPSPDIPSASASPAIVPTNCNKNATPRARDELLGLFAAIETAAVTNLESNSQWYEPSKPAIRLVSSLAEGSDQLAAEIVAREFRARADEGQMRPRAADWSIDAILPAPKGDYVAASRVSARSEPGQPIDVAGQFLAAFALADRLVELPLLTRDGTPADGGDKLGPLPGGLQVSQPVGPDENARLPPGGALHDLAYRRSRRRVEPQAGFRSWRNGGGGAPGFRIRRARDCRRPRRFNPAASTY